MLIIFLQIEFGTGSNPSRILIILRMDLAQSFLLGYKINQLQSVNILDLFYF